jgi:hypothetical protein
MLIGKTHQFIVVHLLLLRPPSFSSRRRLSTSQTNRNVYPFTSRQDSGPQKKLIVISRPAIFAGGAPTRPLEFTTLTFYNFAFPTALGEVRILS